MINELNVSRRFFYLNLFLPILVLFAEYLHFSEIDVLWRNLEYWWFNLMFILAFCLPSLTLYLIVKFIPFSFKTSFFQTAFIPYWAFILFALYHLEFGEAGMFAIFILLAFSFFTLLSLPVMYLINYLGYKYN